MSFIDEEDLQMKRKRKQKHKHIFVSVVAGTVIGATLFAFAIPTFSKLGWTAIRETEASEEKQYIAQSTPQVTNTGDHSGFVQAVDRASEAVVGVINIQRDNFSEADSEAGTGSGVIYKKEKGNAYIVTNNHVVAGANRIEVSLSDGKKVPGKILGTDVVTDLAVLQIDEKYAKKVIELGDSTKVKRGEAALAIGNPLGLEFSGSVTQGIISANERIVPVDLDQDGHYDWQVEVLQTDAAINPGNSGGALVNEAGQLVGINSMKIAAKEVEGIGLAIPIARAVPVMNEIEKYGKVRRPYVGVELRSLNEIPNYYWSQTLHLPANVTEGVCVLDVKSPSPGADAGLREYDVIVAVDGKPVQDIIAFRKILYNKKIDDKMTMTFYRGAKKDTTTVKLGSQQY
ncbi:2-alkenal reductase [Bacillus sp. AFS018417]|uniref:S1C family serine protease n=1 Tax=Bacillus sp. AFS018417 TaxID=2033491 RepID=UPI000BF44EAC|nr:S1C family serine protease [Bacillus sp. AFS018417]PEZ04345.1 2-alkenal reductase [Bacillus sp. AFS018417]